MTNPETRKARQAAAAQKLQSQTSRNNDHNALVADEMECVAPTWNAAQQRRDVAGQECIDEEDSITPTPDSEDDIDEETCSSFSLQECIDEFKARRMRRISTHSRDVAMEKDTAHKLDPAEEDLINQNRCNKEQERKCKPCKNGFCYCFTSDSGDAMGDGADRVPAHVRQNRRSRKSESNQVSAAQHNTKSPQPQERRRQSAPAGLKSSNSPKKTPTKPSISPQSASKDQITAISRLETSSKNAPLIHIIQELHNNCVISEVRVNKHKMQAQRSRSLSSKPSPKKTHFNLSETKIETAKLPPSRASPRKSLPSAPPLDKISELDSLSERFVHSTSLNSSAKSNDSPGRRHKAAGLLLQKRLSQTHAQYKPRNLNEPPPKPPRCSFNSVEDKTSVSTLASTTPSLREAERVLDDFLRSKGVALPGANSATQRRQSKDRKEAANEKAKKQQQQLQQQQQQNSRVATNRDKRKSYPLTQPKPKTHFRKPLPTCPSFSDIERMVDDTKKSPTNYEKNIRHFAEKPIKEHSFGWKESEPDIHQMLNYDANANKRKFRSQAVQAEPQSLGWQIPPKVALDTVDGEVHCNLAANISKKITPVKTSLPSKAEETQKFILSEQLKSFVQSPWSNKSNKMHDATTKKPKSSLKSTSRNFLSNSKKRILKLVSPKKDNRAPRSEPFVARRTPLRSIGVQTSREELRSYETSSTPQSPPGSYFSAVQTSQQSSSTPTQGSHDQPANSQHFDFNRKVHSPPKKPKATIHRKLNFPLSRNNADDAGVRANDDQQLGSGATMTKTYRSFHSDLDQDVLSKMGYILSNIRSKLEASDDHAMRTFQEIERREQQVANGFDYPDSAPPQMRHQTRVDLHRNHRNFAIVQTEHDPIYSEIEEDSIHVSSSPHYESKTGIEHFPAARDPTALYAKVTKRPCKPSRAAKKSAPTAEQQPPSPSTSLAQCMRDSLKSKITLKPLPPLPAPPHHAASTFSASSGALHSQSMNNIRVMEHNSPPKRHRHLSKSDLSLQRSEIFLENLCRSEIIINADSLEPLGKVQNSQLDESSYISINSYNQPTQLNSATRTVEQQQDDDDDDVSYELPHDVEQDHVCHAAPGSQLNLGHIDPPHSTNQSTPKKSNPKPQTFMTKPPLEADARQQLNLDISIDDCLPSTHQSSSCPNTPHRLPTRPFDVVDNECATSLIEVSATASVEKTQPNNNKSALARYQRLKNVLRKSLRKSKIFVKTETKRLSSSLSFPAAAISTTSMYKLNQSELQQCEELLNGSSLNVDCLFSLDGAAEEQPLQQQLAKAVCICRQLPDLEISPEMVEAERLLLFSSLRRDATKAKMPSKSSNSRQSQMVKRFYVDAMRLPIRTDVSQDLFFNYFYICTFYCDGVIRSTQSAECRNHEAIFSDCGIEFACSDEAEVKCEIFMLRLRKVSTISLEPTKKSIMNLLTSSRSSVGSSCDDIVSRFRLHGSFTITSRNFVPYEYVELASKSSNSLCLRSSTSCKIAITPRTQSTNLATEMLLIGRAEVRFPKCTHSGFLNVQQPQNKHHWNRRWCILDGLFVRVWQDVPLGSDITDSELPPLMEFDLRLRSATGPLECATLEQCARPRSFALDCCGTSTNIITPTTDSAAVFFVADTQNDLNAWLLVLNKVFDFIYQWMK